MQLIKADYGLANKIALALGISRAAVCQWEQVPMSRLLQVSEISGIPQEKLRPDRAGMLRAIALAMRILDRDDARPESQLIAREFLASLEREASRGKP